MTASVLPAVPAWPKTFHAVIRGAGRPRVADYPDHLGSVPEPDLAAVAGFASGPPAAVRTVAGAVAAVPVYAGWVAVRPAADPGRGWYVAYTPALAGWAFAETAGLAAGRAGHAFKTEAGPGGLLTVARVLEADADGTAGWRAFVSGRGFDGRVLGPRGAVPLTAELSPLVAGYLAGGTPAGVLLDYLAESGPDDRRAAFADLAAALA